MPIFTQDLFSGTSGTALASHTPDIGTSWTALDNVGLKLNGGGGIFDGTVSTTKTYRTAAAAPSADYYVEATFDIKTVVTTDYAGVAARLPASGVASGIVAYWNGGAGRYWILDYAGSSTFVASAAPSTNDVMRLSVKGTVANLYINGVLKVGPFTVATTAPGYAGVFSNCFTTPNTASTGTHLKNLIATAPDIPFVKTDQLAYTRI